MAEPLQDEWQLVRERERFLVKELLPTELSLRCRCLTEQDKEQIEADERNHGSIHGSTTLLERLRRRGPEAFRQFVCALREGGFLHTAQIIDPKHEVNGEAFSDVRQEELVCILGDVTDIRIEVNIKNITAKEPIDLEGLISQFYDNSKKSEIRKLRVHFMDLLDEEVKPYTSFVKIIKTETNPLVLVFRLSHHRAATKLWNYFENGKLNTIVKKCLSNFEATKCIFESNNLEIEVHIKKDEYEKVLKTLNDSNHVAVIDGEEKKELVLKDFQMELADSVLKGENAIICSPTGSGKTFIAMEVMKKHLTSNDGKKIIFVVNGLSLVQQQRQRFDTYLPNGVKVSSLCGNSIETLSEILKDNDVVVLTAQIMVNALEKNDITISQLSLLVFDECHHTKGKTSYNEIMWWYLKTKKETPSLSLPQVLGLSASLGIGTGNSGCTTKAQQHILELCANLDAHTLKMSTQSQPLTDTKVRPVSQGTSGVFQLVVSEAMEEVTEMLCSSGRLKRTLHPPGSQPYENWIVSVQKENIGRDLMTCAEHLNEYNSALMINDEVRSQDALKYLQRHIIPSDSTDTERKLKEIYDKVSETLGSHHSEESNESSPWLQELEERLLEKFSDDVLSKGIIFVRTRFVASALVDWIKDSPKFKGMKPSYVVGCGQRNGKDGMSKAKQDEEIKKFRDGACNVIIATSTLLEGIDIADCNFVINYGMPGNEITLVQARGRVRTHGTYEIIVGKVHKLLKERDLDKEKVMMEAVANIESMSATDFQNEVKRRQEIVYKERSRIQDQKNAERKPAVTDKIKLFCKKCNAVVCKAQHVKVYCEVHHLVPNYKETLSKVTLKTIRPENIHADLVKIATISCEHCGYRWGNMSRTKYGEFPVLKIQQLRVREEEEDCGGQVYRGGWKDFPYELQIFDPNEVTKSDN